MNRTRQVLASAALTVGVAASIASEELDSTTCYAGHHPIDGATAVPLDTQIILGVYNVERSDPAHVHDSVTVRDVHSGYAIDIDVALDFELEQLIITPVDPLTPDHSYEVVGVDSTEQAGPHQQISGSGASHTARFSTASNPRPLAVWLVDDGGDTATLELVLSQAVDHDSLGEDPVLVSDGLPEGVSLGQAQPSDRVEHGLAVEVTGDPTLLLDQVVGLADHVLAQDGASFSTQEYPVSPTDGGHLLQYGQVYDCFQQDTGGI